MILSLQKALQPAKIRFVITCPDFPVDQDFRPEPTIWPAVFAWLSKTVQSFQGLEAYDLTLDDAIIYDWSLNMNALAQNTGDGRRVTYEEIEAAILGVSFNVEDMRKSKREGIEARNLYHSIRDVDDAMLAHRAYGKPDSYKKQAYPQASLG